MEKHRKFLVIYPHPARRMTLSLMLEHCGHKVTAIKTAAEALECNKNLQRFDAIFMDICQPPIGNIAATDWIKRDAPKSILIGISDCTRRDTKNLARQNIFFCIQKSIELQQVREALQLVMFAIIAQA